MTTPISASTSSVIFQLTSSRRGWLPIIVKMEYQTYFNSHPHEEDDVSFFNLCFTFVTFQLTSSRRGWLCFLPTSYWWMVFQLTSSRRGWLQPCVFASTWEYFNSHPHEEDDEKSTKHATRFPIFQLTSSRRGWRSFIEFLHLGEHFNSHPHEEDDIICLIIKL